jgi:crossover junction endodeoxyribonuclease RuvC
MNQVRFLTIGIDPGLSGAIAFLADGQFADVHDMPTMGRGKGNNKQVDPYRMVAILRGAPMMRRGALVTCRLEEVHAMPGQGLTSTFGFGRSFGVAQGVLAALGYPVTLVSPEKWKRDMGLIGAEKDASRQRAMKYFRSAPLQLKKHDGRAEALLLARLEFHEQMARSGLSAADAPSVY